MGRDDCETVVAAHPLSGGGRAAADYRSRAARTRPTSDDRLARPGEEALREEHHAYVLSDDDARGVAMSSPLTRSSTTEL